MIAESLILTAFLLGLVSAVSLPLGTISSAFWRPSDRVIAFLMAFGGGALLAALTIDLVASSLEKGQFTPLALGCILGGLLFVLLNELVNDYGGFVRKASTTIYYLRKESSRGAIAMLVDLKEPAIFKGLSTQEYRALATGLGGAGIWLEKVSIKTRPSVSVDEVLERDDALSGLLRAIRDMELDASALEDLADVISTLRQKLPAELLGGDDAYDPTKPEIIKETLEDIKEHLVNRLLTTGKGA